MATVEQRVSFIEGKLDSLATKADVADLQVNIYQLETRLTKEISHGIRWMAGLQILSVTAIAGIVLAIVKLLE